MEQVVCLDRSPPQAGNTEEDKARETEDPHQRLCPISTRQSIYYIVLLPSFAFKGTGSFRGAADQYKVGFLVCLCVVGAGGAMRSAGHASPYASLCGEYRTWVTASPANVAQAPPWTKAPELEFDPREFRKTQDIGDGAFGHVYSCFHTPDGVSLVCKDVELSSQRNGAMASAMTEIGLLRVLNHPNIIRAFGIRMDQSKVSMLFPTAESDLAVWVSGRTLAAEDTRCILYQTADALAYLEECDVVHGDVKPQNVLVFGTGGGGVHVQLADFGLAHSVVRDTEGAAIPRSAEIQTLWYRSPELLVPNYLGEYYSQRQGQSDIWAWGCVGYELATNRVLSPCPNAGIMLERLATVCGWWTTVDAIHSLLCPQPQHQTPVFQRRVAALHRRCAAAAANAAGDEPALAAVADTGLRAVLGQCLTLTNRATAASVLGAMREVRGSGASGERFFSKNSSSAAIQWLASFGAETPAPPPVSMEPPPPPLKLNLNGWGMLYGGGKATVTLPSNRRSRLLSPFLKTSACPAQTPYVRFLESMTHQYTDSEQQNLRAWPARSRQLDVVAVLTRDYEEHPVVFFTAVEYMDRHCAATQSQDDALPYVAFHTAQMIHSEPGELCDLVSHNLVHHAQQLQAAVLRSLNYEAVVATRFHWFECLLRAKARRPDTASTKQALQCLYRSTQSWEQTLDPAAVAQSCLAATETQGQAGFHSFNVSQSPPVAGQLPLQRSWGHRVGAYP